MRPPNTKSKAEKYAILRATVVSGVAARCDRELGFIVAMMQKCQEFYGGLDKVLKKLII